MLKPQASYSEGVACITTATMDHVKTSTIVGRTSVTVHVLEGSLTNEGTQYISPKIHLETEKGVVNKAILPMTVTHTEGTGGKDQVTVRYTCDTLDEEVLATMFKTDELLLIAKNGSVIEEHTNYVPMHEQVVGGEEKVIVGYCAGVNIAEAKVGEPPVIVNHVVQTPNGERVYRQRIARHEKSEHLETSGAGFIDGIMAPKTIMALAAGCATGGALAHAMAPMIAGNAMALGAIKAFSVSICSSAIHGQTIKLENVALDTAIGAITGGISEKLGPAKGAKGLTLAKDSAKVAFLNGAVSSGLRGQNPLKEGFISATVAAVASLTMEQVPLDMGSLSEGQVAEVRKVLNDAVGATVRAGILGEDLVDAIGSGIVNGYILRMTDSIFDGVRQELGVKRSSKKLGLSEDKVRKYGGEKGALLDDIEILAIKGYSAKELEELSKLENGIKNQAKFELGKLEKTNYERPQARIERLARERQSRIDATEQIMRNQGYSPIKAKQLAEQLIDNGEVVHTENTLQPVPKFVGEELKLEPENIGRGYGTYPKSILTGESDLSGMNFSDNSFETNFLERVGDRWLSGLGLGKAHGLSAGLETSLDAGFNSLTDTLDGVVPIYEPNREPGFWDGAKSFAKGLPITLGRQLGAGIGWMLTPSSVESGTIPYEIAERDRLYRVKAETKEANKAIKAEALTRAQTPGICEALSYLTPSLQGQHFTDVGSDIYGIIKEENPLAYSHPQGLGTGTHLAIATYGAGVSEYCNLKWKFEFGLINGEPGRGKGGSVLDMYLPKGVYDFNYIGEVKTGNAVVTYYEAQRKQRNLGRVDEPLYMDQLKPHEPEKHIIIDSEIVIPKTGRKNK